MLSKCLYILYIIVKYLNTCHTAMARVIKNVFLLMPTSTMTGRQICLSAATLHTSWKIPVSLTVRSYLPRLSPLYYTTFIECLCVMPTFTQLQVFVSHDKPLCFNSRPLELFYAALAKKTPDWTYHTIIKALALALYTTNPPGCDYSPTGCLF